MIGEQFRPINPVTGPKTRPKRPPSVPKAVELASCTVLQHCMLPTLHWLILGSVGLGTGSGTGVATARSASDERTTRLVLVRMLFDEHES